MGSVRCGTSERSQRRTKASKGRAHPRASSTPMFHAIRASSEIGGERAAARTERARCLANRAVRVADVARAGRAAAPLTRGIRRDARRVDLTSLCRTCRQAFQLGRPVPATVSQPCEVCVRRVKCVSHGGDLMGIPPTNRRAVTHGCTVGQFKNGKSVHDWIYCPRAARLVSCAPGDDASFTREPATAARDLLKLPALPRGWHERRVGR